MAYKENGQWYSIKLKIWLPQVKQKETNLMLFLHILVSHRVQRKKINKIIIWENLYVNVYWCLKSCMGCTKASYQ